MAQKTRGVIAAGDRNTARAGQAMFALGGNAFDAAVAAILASFVVEPTLTSVGGGGFLLAHTADSRNILFDFFTQTPRQKRAIADLDFYPIEVHFGDITQTQTFHIGLGSIAVPGNLAGVFAVQQQLGRLPFAAIAEPAIDYARNGVALSPFQDFCINQLLHPILTALPAGQALYAPTGRLAKAGEKIYMPNFATALTELVAQGPGEFYRGEMARQLVKDCQERGGHLTLADLQNYRVIERKPLIVTYRDRQILTNPPPSSGGALIAFALKLLSTCDLATLEFGSCQHRQLLARVMHLTNAARSDGYDSNLYNEAVAEQFLASEHCTPYQQQLTQTLNKWGSTTHISVIDAEGNAASVTTSNGEGSSYILPGTDIMLNNMLGEADLNPLGFHAWPRDRRLSSMMAPTIVLYRGRPELVLGSGGSNRIRTAILQVLSNLLDFQMAIAPAVESPRVHWENGVFNLEPSNLDLLFDPAQLPEATEVAFWRAKNMFFGGVHAVQKLADGRMTGAGDSRRGGAVLQS